MRKNVGKRGMLKKAAILCALVIILSKGGEEVRAASRETQSTKTYTMNSDGILSYGYAVDKTTVSSCVGYGYITYKAKTISGQVKGIFTSQSFIRTKTLDGLYATRTGVENYGIDVYSVSSHIAMKSADSVVYYGYNYYKLGQDAFSDNIPSNQYRPAAVYY